jgi:hypothetical protein
VPKLTRLARFRRGCWGNLIEACIWSTQRQDFPEFCPVLWCAPFGLALTMPRVTMMSCQEFHIWFNSGGYPDHWPRSSPYEDKPGDWGWLEGQPVVVDYAIEAH